MAEDATAVDVIIRALQDATISQFTRIDAVMALAYVKLDSARVALRTAERDPNYLVSYNARRAGKFADTGSW